MISPSILHQALKDKQILNSLKIFVRPVLALIMCMAAGPAHLLICMINLTDMASSCLQNHWFSQGKEGIVKCDLARNSQNTALIGDPRDDENLIISQIQVLFLRFHNIMVDAIRTKFPTKSPSVVFTEAQELVRWHYQWILIHEYLPLICGQNVVDDVMNNGRKFYGWHNKPYIPVEFSVAAYRFGHSQIRPSYRANFGISN